MLTSEKTKPFDMQREPAWDIAHLFPPQGAWTMEQYFALDTNRLVEFSHGRIEVLPLASKSHQLLVLFFFEVLKAYLSHLHPGFVLLVAPHPVLVEGDQLREPDVIVLLSEHAYRSTEKYCEQPDLVVEVVSPDYRKHDFETKRREYAKVGIPEYWIVDPQEERVLVLSLNDNGVYDVRGTYARGQLAQSALLPGFEVSMDAMWQAAGR